VNDAHDYAQVFLDGKYIGKLDRRNGEKQMIKTGEIEDFLLAQIKR
jgi:hypothetical protein